jgi:hypothetical protein
MRAAGLPQDELAIAMRMDVASGYQYAPSARHIPLFQSVDHYPYSSDFDGDCGMMGRRIDRASVIPPSATSKGNLDRFETPYNPETVRMAGWFGSADGPTRCVLFTDESMRVVGAAATGYVRPDLATGGTPTGSFDLGFYGVARDGADEYRAFAVVSGRDGVYEIPGSLMPDAR